MCVIQAAYTMPIAPVALLRFTSQRNTTHISSCVISKSLRKQGNWAWSSEYGHPSWMEKGLSGGVHPTLTNTP